MQPPLVAEDVRRHSGVDVGSHRSGPPIVQPPQIGASHEGTVPRSCKSSRGLTQKLRAGVARGNRLLGLLVLVASLGNVWRVMELFGQNKCMDATEEGWDHRGPLWSPSTPPGWKECQQLWEEFRAEKPDVVVMEPPAGKRCEYWPMWWLIRKVWNHQNGCGRLALLQGPASASFPDVDEMRQMELLHRQRHRQLKEEGSKGPEEREYVYGALVHLCAFGSVPKRSTVVEVNDPFWCHLLGKGSQCPHAPGDHVPPRSEVCRDDPAEEPLARWHRKCRDTAKEVLNSRLPRGQQVALHEECGVEWEAVPVEVEQSLEGLLRQRLGEVTGERFDYIYFEGGSGALSKPLRGTLARLHVALGHVTKEKLKRMLHLQGADETVVRAAGDLRCQECVRWSSHPRTSRRWRMLSHSGPGRGCFLSPCSFLSVTFCCCCWCGFPSFRPRSTPRASLLWLRLAN